MSKHKLIYIKTLGMWIVGEWTNKDLTTGNNLPSILKPFPNRRLAREFIENNRSILDKIRTRFEKS